MYHIWLKKHTRKTCATSLVYIPKISISNAHLCIKNLQPRIIQNDRISYWDITVELGSQFYFISRSHTAMALVEASVIQWQIKCMITLSRISFGGKLQKLGIYLLYSHPVVRIVKGSFSAMYERLLSTHWGLDKWLSLSKCFVMYRNARMFIRNSLWLLPQCCGP